MAGRVSGEEARGQEIQSEEVLEAENGTKYHPDQEMMRSRFTETTATRLSLKETKAHVSLLIFGVVHRKSFTNSLRDTE